MTTLEHKPPEATTDIWTTALKFTAHHLTAGYLRKLAARMTEEDRALVLRIADAMADLEAQGMTPEDCYNLAGMDKAFGPYMSPAVAVHVAATYMTAGWSSARLPDATRPEVADAIRFLEGLGVTAAGAARIAEAGSAGLPVPSPRPAPDRALSAA